MGTARVSAMHWSRTPTSSHSDGGVPIYFGTRSPDQSYPGWMHTCMSCRSAKKWVKSRILLEASPNPNLTFWSILGNT